MPASTALIDSTSGVGAEALDDGTSACPVVGKKAPPAIAVAHLSVTYPTGVQALDDVSLTVPQGKIFGLLGPNGAGKSTLIRVLCGVILPTSGTALVCGLDPSTRPREVKEQLCGLFQGSPLESNMQVREVLWLFSKFYRHPADPEELLARLGLTEMKRSLCKTLSGGQRQRLAIARALIGNPRVLILDEPTTGLDVAARHELMDIVNQLRSEGRTVLISTHNIEEAETWCDQVAVVSRGKLFAVDSPRAIIERHGVRAKLEIVLSQPLPLERVSRLPGVLDVTQIRSSDGRTDREFLLEGADAEAMLLQVVRLLVDTGVTLDGARMIRSGLEGAYLTLTGERIRS
jgi:ABC-2 type transport system ATP-binding protein